MPLCIMTGGGGHAKVLLDCLQSARTAFDIMVVDANPDLRGSEIMGARVCGGDEMIPALIAEGATHFIVGVGGGSKNGIRRDLYNRMRTFGLDPLEVIAPSAVYSKYASKGPGCQILPNATVNAGARLGCNVIVNTGAVVEHDCVVGDHVHVASRGVLLGGVEAGEGALVGAGAVVRQLVRIGADSVLGAGAVALRDIPPGKTYAGVPAKELLEK